MPKSASHLMCNEPSQEDSMNDVNRKTGIELDTLCTSGRRGGTAFLPVSADVSSEVLDTLGVTAHYIRSGTSSALRRRELKTPRTIPIVEYSPQTQSHFWTWVEDYADQHDGDTNPRLFGMAKVDDLQHFQQTQSDILTMQGDEELARKLDIPLFTQVPSNKGTTINEKLFGQMAAGVTQGLILEKKDHVRRAYAQWEEFRAKQENPDLIVRPFIGYKGGTADLLKLMRDDSTEVDTLIYTDAPSREEALEIHKMHIGKMRKNKKPKKINNPFNVESPLNEFHVAVLNVQGSARKDASALLEASRIIEGLNVEVYLVENGDQLQASNADAIVFPGGWHKIQYDRQEELGINDMVEERIRRGVHALALCAGSIQGRKGDDKLDKVKSEGCVVGTSFGIGDYRVVNNVLSNPRDVLVAIEKYGDVDEPGARVFKNIPFSNAPHFKGVNMETMEVIARLSTQDNDFAASVDDEVGHIVGLKVKRTNRELPVQLVAAFHDKIIFTLFLDQMQQYYMDARYNGERLGLARTHHEREKNL